MPPLSNRLRESFCLEYIKDKNATQAAIRAGYSPKTANEQGAQLLAILSVKERVTELLGEISAKAKIDATWIREKLRQNVERAMEAEPVLDSEGNPIGIYKYQGQTANKALELLGKDQGMFSDKIEVTLNRESRELIESITRLAVDCCAENKRSELVNGINSIRTQYASILGR